MSTRPVTKTADPAGMTKMHILVLAATCLFSWGTMGMPNAYGVFFTPMGEVLGVGRAAVTLHFSLRALAVGIASPFVAVLLKKGISIRKTMPIGLAVYMLMCILIAHTKSIILVYIFAVIAGLGFATFSYMFIAIVLGNWFRKNLGTISGIAMAFSGVGSAIASPIVTKMIESLGYQKAYIAYSAITVAMVLPLLLLPFYPEDADLLPYGAGVDEASEDQKLKKKAGMTARNLDLPYSFPSAMALILFLLTFFCVGLTSLNSHLPSLAIANGFSADIGALLLSASMIGNLSFKLVLGVLIDKLGVLKGFLIVLMIMIAGSLIILFVTGAVAPLLVGGFLYGTIFSLGSLGLSLLVRFLYGNEQYNGIYAKTALITSVGAAVYTTLIGVMYDATGSYTLPIFMGVAMAGISIAMIFWIMIRVRKL